MEKEFLIEYEQKERSEFERLEKRILEGEFSFEKDTFPPDNRFIKLQKPVALTALGTSNLEAIWVQIPFCGSLILLLPPIPKYEFEQFYFKVSEIPKIIDFVKETGHLQVSLSASPLAYENLDFLDPFFVELNPPVYSAAPNSIFRKNKEVQQAINHFRTLASVRYIQLLRELFEPYGSKTFEVVFGKDLSTYVTMKIGQYDIVEDIENAMTDNPEQAFSLLSVCETFVDQPIRDLRSSVRNFSFEEAKAARQLPFLNQIQRPRFPYEIGKFLFKNLTYAPQGFEACKEIMSHYDRYDLHKVLESLNEAIVENDPEVVNKSTTEFSEILDNVWNDQAIPKRAKVLESAIPFSIAAVGSVAAGPIGAVSGFLAGLGFKVADRFTERFAKLGTKNYQVNIYDFKKKYAFAAKPAIDRAVNRSEKMILKSALTIARSKGHTVITDEDMQEAIEKTGV